MAGFGDIGSILGKVQELQQRQEQLRNSTFEAGSGGGMVTVKINGKNEVLDIKIDPQAVNPDDIEMLEDLVKAAINAAVARGQEEMKKQVSDLTSGMNFPGMGQINKLLGLE
ncbi:MAG: YbaB/EbfC family nucleoid-associated protein [Sedimentisphaerales bacterium]|nr:YbaB/EbfC family nucleoid-associated protein [Sedimentisphaerales bacterium]